MGTFSEERMKQFISASKKYYSWEQILIDSGFTTYKPIETGLQLACVFHADKRPSLYINYQMGTYHCFSCGRKGTVTRFMYELSGNDIGYGNFCEQLLKANKALINELGFDTLYVEATSLDEGFNRKRVFSAKSHIASEMPMQVLSRKTRSLSTPDTAWQDMAFCTTLLQQGINTDTVWSTYKRKKSCVQQEVETVVSLENIILGGG